jgi:hypothetical protein
MPNLTLPVFQNWIVTANGAAPVAQTLGANNEYLRYDLTHNPGATFSRCTHTLVGLAAGGAVANVGQPVVSYRIAFTPSATGDTFFLPFNNNQIHSVALPLNPGPLDVRHVFTANLSGCALFIDTDPVNNLLYFHHANCIGGLYNVANPTTHPPSTQTPAAVGRLTTLHQNGLTWFGWHANVVPATSLFKSTYYAQLDTEWRRKRSQFRFNVEAWGGTTAWGFYNGASWEFWYQTFGSMTYSRPFFAPKGWVNGQSVTIMNKKSDALLDVQQFH